MDREAGTEAREESVEVRLRVRILVFDGLRGKHQDDLHFLEGLRRDSKGGGCASEVHF